MSNENENKETIPKPQAQTEPTFKPEDKINIGLVDEARENAKRIEEANEVTRQLLERKEKLEAVRILSGKTEAGHIEPEPEPETAKEYAARVLRGDLNVKN
jgi:hypothetical protein